MGNITFEDIAGALTDRLIARGWKPVPPTRPGQMIEVRGPYSPDPVRISDAFAIELDAWFREKIVAQSKVPR